jgi:hypothetical protein
MIIARYNGINESMIFKSPSKLPAVVFFKKSLNDQGKIETKGFMLQDIEKHLLKNSSEEELFKSLRKVIQEN